MSAKASPSLDDKNYAAPPIEKETRFAVVMYGGISLAIYIHGVAQELYHMVRATARKIDNQTEYVHPWDGPDGLSGTEKVYRRLGEALKTKFVVDILSGTSAGGLNAVFLAKAIANQQSSMEFVKGFWIREGDISTLLNDKESLSGLSGLSLQEPTPGLMNSQRFYYKILEALMKMESHELDFKSPYVEELDLNITATDIRGLNLPLYINDGNAIQEARYKNVFQFYYRPKRDVGDKKEEVKKETEFRNDFARSMDPFLAFAARCTASIPPAFEAMQLKDIEPILQTARFKDDYGKLTLNNEDWKRIYREYVNEGDDFEYRSFGDGGYLDNKPFSYATESLLRRRADLPVDRRLIYIEPSPEHPEDKPLPSERPDMLENILAALVNLPRSETIREDLENIQKRNAVIRKIKRMLSGVSYKIPNNPKVSREKNKPWTKSEQWAKLYLMDKGVLDRYGQGYIAYHNLLVENVLENLSTALARAIGWPEGGEEERRLDRLMHDWLNEYYGIESGKSKKSQNDILYRLDLSYRMRRCHFLQGILNTIIQNIEKYITDEDAPENEIPKIFDAAGMSLEIGKEVSWDTDAISDVIWILSILKSRINGTYAYMKSRALGLRKSGLINDTDNKELQKYIETLQKIKSYFADKKTWEDLTSLIEEASTQLADEETQGGYLYRTMEWARKEDEINGLREGESGKGKSKVGPSLIPFDEAELEKLLRTRYPADEKNGEERDYPNKIQREAYFSIYEQVQQCLRYYYKNFDFYDMLTFPIQYGTDAGESDEVEVIRVSPEDATLLINEREEGRKKLTGTSLANFGAFFKKEWRENDIMWGRLDAAEILISQLTGWKPDVNDMDEDERKKWNDFMVRLKELHQEEFPMADTDFARTEDFPFNLAFQIILEEDLRPRDDFIFYSFIDGKFETEDKTGDEAAAPKPETKAPPELQKLLAREESLDKLESALQKALRENIGSAPDRLKKEIIDPVAKEKESVKRKKEEQENSLRGNQKDLSSSVKSSAGGLKSLPDAISGKMKAGLKKLRKNNNLRYKEVMRSLREDPHEILKYFRSGYEVDKKFPPETLNTASRAISVLEKLLLGLSEKHPFLSGIKGPISTTSRLGTGLLLAARGGSYTTVVAIAFYISSLLVILAGWLIPSFKDSMPIGVLAFLLTLVAHVSALQIRFAFLGKVHLPSKIAIEILSVIVGMIPFFLVVALALLIYLGLLGLGWLDVPPGPLGEWIKLLIAACPKTVTPDMPLFCRPAE